jgi:hypothetical protein
MLRVLFLAFILPFNCIASDWSYFDYTSVNVGIDMTYKKSPQCYKDGISDKLTSNLEFRQHLAGDEQINIYATYRHHSCVFNTDTWNVYNSLGVGVEYKIFHN